MGIKNLLKFLSEYPELIKEKETNEYYGKKIRDILNYTPQQLDDFFSKRYK